MREEDNIPNDPETGARVNMNFLVLHWLATHGEEDTVRMALRQEAKPLKVYCIVYELWYLLVSPRLTKHVCPKLPP